MLKNQIQHVFKLHYYLWMSCSVLFYIVLYLLALKREATKKAVDGIDTTSQKMCNSCVIVHGGSGNVLENAAAFRAKNSSLNP